MQISLYVICIYLYTNTYVHIALGIQIQTYPLIIKALARSILFLSLFNTHTQFGSCRIIKLSRIIFLYFLYFLLLCSFISLFQFLWCVFLCSASNRTKYTNCYVKRKIVLQNKQLRFMVKFRHRTRWYGSLKRKNASSRTTLLQLKKNSGMHACICVCVHQ